MLLGFIMRFVAYLVIFHLLLGLLLFTPAFSADVPLTLAQAQLVALNRSRQLEAQDLSAMSSQEMAKATIHLPDPVLKMGVENLPVSGSERFSLTKDFMTMRSVGLMQELTSVNKRQARADLYLRSADRLLAEKEALAANIQRDTALAWLDRYYAEQMVIVINDQIVQARLEIQAAESAYRSGRGSQSDIFSARSSLVQMEDRSSEIQQRVSNAKIALTRWIGNLAEESLADKPMMENIPLNVDSIESQLEHHPQITVLNKQIDIAQADAELAKANKSSDWSVELMYQQRDAAYSNMISVGISIPLQWNQKNRQDREHYAKLVKVDQAKAERDELLRQHVAETKTMISEWNNNRERIARYESELIPLAKERIQVVIAAYCGGKANLSSILAARRGEIDVRIQSLQLQNETARLWAQLNFLTPTISKELQ